MKKMMTLAACLLLAAVTQGAAVGWSLAGATAYKGGGYDVFLIGAKGVTSQAQITALLASDGVDALSTYAWGSGTVNNSGAANQSSATSGKSITFNPTGGDAANTYQAFMVIWDAAGENASWSDVKSITLANDATGKTFTFANQATNLSNNNIDISGGGGAPEPTSGLLLLVGGAMLALRRKQK